MALQFGRHLGCLTRGHRATQIRAWLGGDKGLDVAYVDWQGKLHFPFDEVFERGRKFSAAEPSTVWSTSGQSSVTPSTK
jgi:hypothetical protein